MTKLVALAIVEILLIALSNANAGESTKYLGSVISDGKPAGYKESGGSCIPDSNGNAATCVLALSGGVLTTSTGQKERVLWLTSKVGKDANGHSIFRAEDVLEIPRNAPGHSNSSSANCKSINHPSAFIVARGPWHWRKKPRLGGYVRPITNAWVVDIAKKQFRAIPTVGVTCEIEEEPD